ncbi:MAG TPA: hypothetical protein VFV01_06875 [Spirillospora sp.]|nr:hypothetical protein [Spirillospora sp.]
MNRPDLHDDTVKVILAVLEGIAIPYAATTAHDETRTRVLHDRLIHVQVTLESLLGSAAPDVDDAVSYLQEKLAEHPPVGYITKKQAHRRIKAGATWMQAVSLDYRDGQERLRARHAKQCSGVCASIPCECGPGDTVCNECETPYPCSTIRALDEEGDR